MHAMSSRHPHHTFHNHSQHNAPSPPPPSPYNVCSNSADLLTPSTHQQSRSSSPYASHLVTHHLSTRSRSPVFPSTPVSASMPRINSPVPPPPPPSSSRGHTCDVVPPAPSPTPRPPEDVVMTSTINFTRDTRDRPIINQYLIGHRLGTGQHGEVYKGYDMRRGNMVVAIKACRRKNPKEAKVEQLRQRNQAPIPRTTGGAGGGLLNARPRLVDQLQNTEKKVLREIAIMKKCKHGQIVQLYEVINDRLTNKILLVIEYMGGGEVKWRDDAGRPCLRVDQTRRICRDVVLGLLYLHHQGIIHRDIKPANLLWTADRKNVKITDFGVSHFSAAQRIDALKHSTAYREALQHRIQARKKREEESSGTATPARKKSGGVWRGKGGGSGTSSKEDVKGKGRARDSLPPPPSSSLNVSSDDEDAAAEKELLNELAGDVDPILLDDGGLSRQAGTPSFLAPEIIWEFGEKQTAALYNRVGLSRAKLKRVDDGSSEKGERAGEREHTQVYGLYSADADVDSKAITSSLSTMLKTPRRPSHTDEESTPRPSDVATRKSLEVISDALSPPSGPSPSAMRTQSTIPDPDPSSFHDPNAVLAAEGEGEEDFDLPPRPPITKAIDVWALGVTLYCLLFGRTPWGGVTEFAMYQMIHTEDFQVDETMGYDRVPTGGRFHEPGDTSEGAIVIGLLDRLLEKDCSKRITLEGVKRLPWITRDIPNPEEWVAETAPERLDPIQITTADEDVAMTSVKFRWRLDVTKPLRRFRTLWPASRRATAARQQQQHHHVHQQQIAAAAQRRTEADQHEMYTVELDEILHRSLHIESESEKSERVISFAASRIAVSEGLGLTRKPSRSRRVVDAVERGVRKISRQGTPSVSGGETPRNLKRRTLPDLMIGTRGRSMSHSREGSPSRSSSRASGPTTPRIASGGSRSNLTSPSTAGFTSDGETDILDSDDLRAIRSNKPSRCSLRRDRKEWEKEHRQKASARASLSNIGKILSWRPKGSPRASLSESSSKGSIGMGWMGFAARSPATSPASPAGGSGSGSGRESGPASARASFATQRLTRRSADEFGSGARMGLMSANGVRAMSTTRVAAPGAIGARSDSGPAIASAGVATDSRGFALASADELTNAMRASSWGDVADEFRYDYGYGATVLRGDVECDADGISDYGFGSGSAYGDSMYGNGRSFAFESGDIDGYANDDNDEVRLVGAGGILSHPVSGPSSPNSLSGVSVGASIGVVPQDGFSLQGVVHEVGTASPGPASAGVVVSSPGVTLLQTAQLQDTAGRRRGASVGSRHTHHVPHVVSSPLAQSPMNVHDSPGFDELDLDQDVKLDLSRNSSAQGSINVSFERPSPDSESSGPDARREERIVVVGHGVTSLKVEDEVRESEHEEVFADDDSSSSEGSPIEVKRRRPSEILARSRSRVRPDVPPPPESAPAATSVPMAGVDDNTEIC